MNAVVHAKAPKLKGLAARHGVLGERLAQLRQVQREEIANAAFDEGFVNALSILEVPVQVMTPVMREAGYDQCGGCEEWFPELELEEVEDAEFLEVGARPKRCTECNLAEEDWAAPPPPVPTTPEEIAAAEEKKGKARQAVIRQGERAQQRQEILDDYERGEGTN